ncbi:MAG: alpha/beta hydrolase [Comamonadaceae bacterium]|nr:alpha/beta hydrolase [Comamonadaceae bacterium]
MADHAAALAAEGVLAVTPDLPYVTDSRKNARALADLIGQLRAGLLGPPIERVVLVGFSAGGLSSLLAADAPGVVGYVGLDAFDRPGGVGLEAARRLTIPARLLRAPAVVLQRLRHRRAVVRRALRGLVEDRVIEHASHCDFESPTTRACEMFCGNTDPRAAGDRAADAAARPRATGCCARPPCRPRCRPRCNRPARGKPGAASTMSGPAADPHAERCRDRPRAATEARHRHRCTGRSSAAA